MREKIINAVAENKLIVIVRGVAREDLIPLGEALYAGGVRLMEITYDATGKTPDSETAENIKMLVEHFENRMFIGTGTVLRAEQVDLTAKAGGGFIISPDVSSEVITKTRELGLVSMPGALTPTEAQTAHKLGADFVKLFPVTSLGAEYVKALRAPLSHIKFLAVGGVGLDNMKDYLVAGISGFGIGGSLVNRTLIRDGKFDEITALAKKYTEILI